MVIRTTDHIRTRNLPIGLLAANEIRRIDVLKAFSWDAEGTPPAAFDMPLEAISETLSEDPVARRLLDGLGRAGDEDDDGAYETALRLALVARLLSSRPGKAENQADELQKWRLKRVTAYVEEHIGRALPLSELARIAGLSRMYFAARFRAATGMRPHDYVVRRRIERAKDLLVRTDDTLAFIAMDVGFQTQAHFTTVFKKVVGHTPGRWRSINRPMV